MGIEYDRSEPEFNTNIKVIGVGGAGGNAVNTMIEKGIDGVEFIVANTDIKDLRKSSAKIKIQIGEKLTKGCGTGANPEKGKAAALESKEQLTDSIKGADMLIISAGFGGGTGTGAAPVIAEIAREMNILSLAIITKPLQFENNQRMQNYEQGLTEIRQHIDSFIVIPNDKIIDIDDGSSVFNVFKKADGVIYDAAKAMSDVINKSGYIQVDFADVQTVMANNGCALVGTSICEGENKAEQCARQAISNPLMNEIKLSGCSALLVNITGGEDTTFKDFQTIMSIFKEETGSNTKTIAGLVRDDAMKGSVSVTVFASGIVDEATKKMGIPPLVHIKNKDNKTHRAGELLNPQWENTSISKINSTNNQLSSKEEIKVPSFMLKF